MEKREKFSVKIGGLRFDRFRVCAAFRGRGRWDFEAEKGEFGTIQAAIDAANIYDVVVVQEGTYTGEGNRDIDFKGKAISVMSENGAENCIIDCNGNPNEPHRGFHFHNGEDGNSVLEGLTIVNGFGPERVGGAMFCEDSSPMIRECIIKDNTADGQGGGIYCKGSKAEFSSCTITGNSASDGGAIYCEGGVPIIKGCEITDNRGERVGGGIGSYKGEMRISDCTMNGNSASRGGGGAVYCRYGKLSISECVLSMNHAGSKVGGGGIYCTDSEAKVSECVVSGNSSEGYAGGVSCWDGTMAVKNCVISGNIAEKAGGGCWDYRGNLTLNNCTVTGNVAAEYGGGILSMRGESVITNCIVWGNESPNGPEIYLGNEDSVFVSYSDIKGGEGDVYVEADANLYWGAGNIDIEPEFVEEGYWDANGTAGDVNDDFWVEGDYHLLEGSPCIDSGDPNYVAWPGETDLDGKPRVADGDGDGVAVVDMGAYEAELPAIEVWMKITPQTLNCESEGRWVKAHIVLPEGYWPEDIDVSTLAVIEPTGAESEYIKVFNKGRGRFGVEIGFEREAFCAMEPEGEDGYLDVEVTGWLLTGQRFEGADTIKIVNQHWRYRHEKRFREKPAKRMIGNQHEPAGGRSIREVRPGGFIR